MDSEKFVEIARNLVASVEQKETKASEVYYVWFNYTLGNMKGLFATRKDNGLYYEVTYDVSKKKMFIDSYAHVNNMEFEV